MKTIRISDVTLKQEKDGFSLSFKEKIELAKLLDKLEVSVIELDGITSIKIDSLRIKSIAAAVSGSTIAVPVQLSRESVDITWNALQHAKKARLQVCAPVSSVQMEYLFHKKPDVMIAAIADTVKACSEVCSDVEFVADDATRSDPAFLAQAITAAIDAGASTVTLCDTAGTMLPVEFSEFVKGVNDAVPALANVVLGVSCANALAMADSSVIAAINEGAQEIKAAACSVNTASLANVSKILHARGDSIGAACSVRVTQLKRCIDQITWMCQTGRSKNSPFDNGVQDEATDIYLTAHDDLSGVLKAVDRLGYDLSEEDGKKVYEAFQAIASKKEKVTDKELDAIVASAAMQVPSTYKLDSYIITSGNTISATAHLKLYKADTVLEGVSIGDGPIDAAFLAIEGITGRHYELDDFQIQSVTEGREAMGQTIVKLRSDGKLYSGKGISTDIVGASIRAYISALNKIVYEEEEA
jgi:2-isopropylmalate synthase